MRLFKGSATRQRSLAIGGAGAPPAGKILPCSPANDLDPKAPWLRRELLRGEGRRLLGAFALLLLAALAPAEQPLALSAALDEARRSHPILRAAQAEVDAARARGWMLQTPYRPMVGLNAFGSLGHGEMIFASSTEPLSLTHMNADEQATLNGMLMWKVFSFGRDRVARAVANSETGASTQMLRLEETELAMRVRIAFSVALLRRDALAARKAAEESADEVLRTTKAALDAGKVPEAFLFRAQADESAMRRETAMAEADANVALAALKEAVGQEQGTGTVLGDWDVQLDAPKTQGDAVKQARDLRAELSNLKATQTAFSLRARLFGLSSLPEFSLTAMGDLMALSDMHPDSSYRLGFVLSFPLADGGERRSGRAEQQAMADKAAADLDAARLKVDSEVAQAWAMWQAAPKVRQAADDEAKSGEESYRVALLRYREGKAILAEVIDARAQLVAAKLAKAEAEDYTRRAWAMLQRAMGC